jgi:hypothetical protein
MASDSLPGGCQEGVQWVWPVWGGRWSLHVSLLVLFTLHLWWSGEGGVGGLSMTLDDGGGCGDFRRDGDIVAVGRRWLMPRY